MDGLELQQKLAHISTSQLEQWMEGPGGYVHAYDRRGYNQFMLTKPEMQAELNRRANSKNREGEEPYTPPTFPARTGITPQMAPLYLRQQIQTLETFQQQHPETVPPEPEKPNAEEMNRYYVEAGLPAPSEQPIPENVEALNAWLAGEKPAEQTPTEFQVTSVPAVLPSHSGETLKVVDSPESDDSNVAESL